MQILKGDVMKSVTVQHILENTHSECYVYYNTELPFDHYYINSNYFTLEDLKDNINQYMMNQDMTDPRLDYFIIYTNNTEEELKDLLNWLDGKSNLMNASCILVTCKP